MKLVLIENSANPEFVRIERDDLPGVKQIAFSKEELTAPLTTFQRESSAPQDIPIVRLLKMAANKLSGFDSWEEARDFLASIPDVAVALSAFGLTLEEALRYG